MPECGNIIIRQHRWNYNVDQQYTGDNDTAVEEKRTTVKNTL